MSRLLVMPSGVSGLRHYFTRCHPRAVDAKSQYFIRAREMNLLGGFCVKAVEVVLESSLSEALPRCLDTVGV